MSQRRWKYIDVFGKAYNIGFYHGPESGHFILYINEAISIIEFNIKEDKIFSFYIGPELLQLHLKKDELGDFEYDLEYDVKFEKPSLAETILKYVVLTLFGFIAIFVLTFVVYWFWR